MGFVVLSAGNSWSKPALPPIVNVLVPVFHEPSVSKKDKVLGIIDATAFQKGKSFTGIAVRPDFILAGTADFIRGPVDKVKHAAVGFPTFLIGCKIQIDKFYSSKVAPDEILGAFRALCYVENHFVYFRFI